MTLMVNKKTHDSDMVVGLYQGLAFSLIDTPGEGLVLSYTKRNGETASMVVISPPEKSNDEKDRWLDF
jgi:hypothetical protein